MKLLTLTASVLIGIGAATSAEACINPCNFNGVNINMGNLQVGQTGTIYEDLALYPLINDDLGVSLAFGYIPTNSEVLFTYTFTGLEDNQTNALTSSISYNYTQGGNTYTGFSNGNSLVTSGPFGPGVLSQGGSVNGNSVGANGIPQVFATANLPSLTNGSTTISNYALGLQEFTTTLQGFFSTPPDGTVTIGYQVIGSSPYGGGKGFGTPLPASLPMMLVVVAGLFGFAHTAKNRKAVSA